MGKTHTYLVDSTQARRLPKSPRSREERRELARRLLSDTRATLLAVAVRYYGGDALAAKTDIYGRH